jgi:hypothetical protein
VLFFTANDGMHGNELWKSDGTAEGTDAPAHPAKVVEIPLVPAKYNQKETSDLNYVIQGGPQTIDLDLKD